jgi:hypothetical protein
MKPKKKQPKKSDKISLAELKAADFAAVSVETFGKTVARGAKRKK